MTELNRAEMAKMTATLSHIGGILEALPLADYAATLRAQRDALPAVWEGCDAAQLAERRRIQALLAVATQADNIVDEVHTAAAFREQMRALAREEAMPEPQGGLTGTVLRFPSAERLAAQLEGEASGPA